MNKLLQTGYLKTTLKEELSFANSSEKYIYDSIKKEYEDPFIIKNRENIRLILNATYTIRNFKVVKKLMDELKNVDFNNGSNIIESPSGHEGGTFLNIGCTSNNFKLHQELYNQFETRFQTQMWYENHINEDNSVVYSPFKQIVEKIIKKYYNISKENINTGQIRETYYNIGNHIIPHEDGTSEKRLCVILMYLSNNYEDGMGGEFNILDKEKYDSQSKAEKFDEIQDIPPLDTIKPNFGNIAVLDFTKNNNSHSVNKVLKDYGRNALITFVNKK